MSNKSKYPKSLKELKIIETHPQKYKLNLLDEKFKITIYNRL
jgi:hypothetical protein